MDWIFEPTHLLLIAAAGLILFGPKRLPQLGRKMGQWLGEFRNATGGLQQELKAGLNEPLNATPATPASPGPAAVPAPATSAEPVKAETPPEPGPKA